MIIGGVTNDNRKLQQTTNFKKTEINNMKEKFAGMHTSL